MSNYSAAIDRGMTSTPGIRPLQRSTAKTVSQISCDHSIEVLSGNWTNLRFPVYSLVGGKWTSFRAFSEQATDKAPAHLGLKRKKDTCSLSIGGGRGYPSDPAEISRQKERKVAEVAHTLSILAERHRVQL